MVINIEPLTNELQVAIATRHKRHAAAASERVCSVIRGLNGQRFIGRITARKRPKPFLVLTLGAIQS